jgi:hypothetical protein
MWFGTSPNRRFVMSTERSEILTRPEVQYEQIAGS